MKKFLTRFLLFFLLLLSIQHLSSLIIPYYNYDKLFLKKHNFFHSNSEKYNTLLFGSSALYRGVNPNLLDSILSCHKTSSFNLATPATYNPESYFIYDHFVTQIDSGKINLCLVEIQPLHLYADINIKAIKGNYWNSIRMLSYCLNYISNSDLPSKLKITFRKQYLKSWIYSVYSLNKVKYLARVLFNNAKYLENTNGYYSLEMEMKKNGKTRIKLEKRNLEFHNDTSSIIQRISAASKFGTYNDALSLNNEHLRVLKQMISKSSQKGIHLIYIIPPLLGDYSELIPIYNHLPKKNIIEVADYNKYKQLYLTSNLFDIGHLNTNGLNQFTKYVAAEINIILNDSCKTDNTLE